MNSTRTGVSSRRGCRWEDKGGVLIVYPRQCLEDHTHPLPLIVVPFSNLVFCIRYRHIEFVCFSTFSFVFFIRGEADCPDFALSALPRGYQGRPFVLELGAPHCHSAIIRCCGRTFPTPLSPRRLARRRRLPSPRLCSRPYFK